MAPMKHITVGIIASAGFGVFLTGCKSDDKKPTTPPKTGTIVVGDADKEDKAALQNPGPDSKQRTPSVKRQEKLEPDIQNTPIVLPVTPPVDQELLKRSEESFKKKQTDQQPKRLDPVKKTSDQRKQELWKISDDLKAKFKKGGMSREQLKAEWEAAIKQAQTDLVEGDVTSVGLQDHEVDLHRLDMEPWWKDIKLKVMHYKKSEGNTKTNWTNSFKVVVTNEGEATAYKITKDQMKGIEKTLDQWYQTRARNQRNGLTTNPQVGSKARLDISGWTVDTQAKSIQKWFDSMDAPTTDAFAKRCEQLAHSEFKQERIEIL